MKRLKTVTHLGMLMMAPSLFAYPQNHIPHVVPQKVNRFENWCWGNQKQAAEWVRPTTYDEIIQMLEDLESGELEKKYSPMQLERINDYIAILAKEGILPNELEEEAELEEDICDLIYGEDSSFQLTRYLENSHGYMIIPAVFNGYSGYNIVQCGKISKAWKKTKKFCKKHKKAIIIGAVIVVAVPAITVAVVAASSGGVAAAASGAVGAATAAETSTSRSSRSRSPSSRKSESTSKPEPTSKPESSLTFPAVPSGSQLQISSNDIPIFKSAMEEQIASFKENLAQENFFQPPTAGQGLPVEEIGRVIGPIFAHDSFNHFNDHFSNCPQFSQEMQRITLEHNFLLPSEATTHPVDFGHDEIDRRFASNLGPMFSDSTKKTDFNTLSYQMRGEASHFYGYYDQSVSDFTQAISMNPMDPTLYLQRSASYFDMGQYNKAVEDFNHFAAQVEKNLETIPFPKPEFTLGFAKGFPKGVYESGKGIMLFLGDLVTHPIHTATQMYDALSTLARLACDDQWGLIGEVLSPEIHQLVTDWDTLSSDKRGELAGYAFGKHGADIALPGAAAKIASKSVKSARELTAILKNLQKAEKTLVLETVAEAGNTAKVGEIINAGKTSAFLGEEVGLTAKEMGQLKKAGNLEVTINNRLDILVSQSESDVFKAAISKNRHVNTARDYLEKPSKQILKGIRSHEKQIAIHQEKIANPSKFIPDWNKLNPRRRKALVNSIWPDEIQGHIEQIDILQSILNERIN